MVTGSSASADPPHEQTNNTLLMQIFLMVLILFRVLHGRYRVNQQNPGNPDPAETNHLAS